MKKSILLIILFYFLINLNNLLAKSVDESFVEDYQITLDNLNSERAFEAFLSIHSNYKSLRLDKAYRENTIVNETLRKVIGEILIAIENPKVARDYYLKGLLAYTPGPDPEHPDTKYLNYVINNFPDSIYAEFCHVHLGLYDEYLEKYGDNGNLVARVYFKLADKYSRFKNIDTETGRKNIELFLRYSNKILNEYPERKNMVIDVQLYLARYQVFIKEYEKALEMYFKLYKNPIPVTKASLYAGEILYVYKLTKDYEKMGSFLQDMKLKYSQNLFIKKLYKKYKKNLDEINKFGFDENALTQDDVSTKIKIFKEKQNEISKFREEWEREFNRSWPELPEEKRGKEILKIFDSVE